MGFRVVRGEREQVAKRECVAALAFDGAWTRAAQLTSATNREACHVHL